MRSGGGTSEPSGSPVRAVIQVTDAWVRLPMAAGSPGAAYMVIVNEGTTADALVGVSTSSASSVEMHQTTTDSSGMSGMHPISRLDLPAMGTVSLEPGGYHLMLMGLGSSIKAGDKITLELTFEHFGVYPVEAEVRAG